MNEENLFKILKASIYGGELDLSENCDYEQLFPELQSQTVLTLTKPVFNQLPLSQNLHEKREKAINQQLAKNARVAFEEQRICKLLKGAGISFAIIKGIAAAQYYPKPELRTRGDIDILPVQEQHAQTVQLLLDAGFKSKKDINFEARHIELFKNDVEVEVHNSFSYNDELYYSALKDAKLFNGVPVLPDAENGCALLWHISFHLKNELGLRQFVDWCMFVNSACTEEFWETRLKPLAEQANLVKLAKALTKAGVYSGLIQRSCPWCGDVPDDVCEALLEMLIYNGNFYSKHTLEERKMMTARAIKLSPKELLAVLNKNKKTLFTTLRKYISSNSSIEKKEQKHEAERRKKLFKELGI